MKSVNTHNRPYTRALSVNERFWLVIDRINPPFSIQVVCEGQGAFDLSKWKKAVEIASAANPGSRLILKGMLSNCRWVDSGISPSVREVDGSSWSGNGPEGAPFLYKPLNVSRGPTCEVLIIHGNPIRVAFRVHHGVMDSRGIIFWVEEIFRALRGEPLFGSHSLMTDWDVARSFQNEYRKPFPHDNLSLTGRAEGDEPGIIWGRKRLLGQYKQLIAQVAHAAAREARLHGRGNVRFAIPVDLRSRIEGLRSTGNLAIGIYIDIKPETTVEEIDLEISRQIAEKRDGMIDRWDSIYRVIPIAIMSKVLNRRISANHKNGLYSLSGIITDAGWFNLERYSGGGFIADNIFFVPPAMPYPPVLIALYGTDKWVEILYGAPRVLATGGRLDSAIERIASSLITACSDSAGV